MTSSEITAIATTAIAALAMIATFTQAAIARKHNKLSVRPHLDWGRMEHPGETVHYLLENNGTGPAIIESFIIYTKLATYEIKAAKTPTLLFHELVAAPMRMTWTLITPESPIVPGRSIKLMEISDPPTSEDEREQAIRQLESIRYLIRYRSVYCEKFELRVGEWNA